MALEVAVPIEQLGAALRAAIIAQVQLDTETLRTTIATDIGHAIVARAIVKTNKADAVHMGAFKLGWRVVQDPDGVDVTNDVPYAGVIELGRRPRRPGPPLAPILEWVQRKVMGGSSKTLAGAPRQDFGAGNRHGDVQRRFDAQGAKAGSSVEEIAEAIRWSIHIKGTKPRFILRDSLDIVPKATKAAVKRYLPTLLNASAPKGATGT